MRSERRATPSGSWAGRLAPRDIVVSRRPTAWKVRRITAGNANSSHDITMVCEFGRPPGAPRAALLDTRRWRPLSPGTAVQDLAQSSVTFRSRPTASPCPAAVTLATGEGDLPPRLRFQPEGDGSADVLQRTDRRRRLTARPAIVIRRGPGISQD